MRNTDGKEICELIRANLVHLVSKLSQWVSISRSVEYHLWKLK